MDAVDILPNEKVQIVNNNNGARFETYVIPGPRGSGTICLNGAAARLVQVGDTVIIIAYAMMTEAEARNYQPKIAFIGDGNKIVEMAKREEPQTIF
jgi:aspartate 1-decarboxylase